MSIEKSIKSDSKKIIATIAHLLKLDKQEIELDVLSNSEVEIEMTGYDNWDGGTYSFVLTCKTPVTIYSKIQNDLQAIEEVIKNKTQHVFKSYNRCWIESVVITPQILEKFFNKVFSVSSEELVQSLETQKSLMVSVSTGGPQIKFVNAEYIERNKTISKGLNERQIKNPIIFTDLWGWHGKWSDGSLPTYRDRREFLSQLIDPIVEKVQAIPVDELPTIFEEPTGWSRVDRSIREIKAKLALAETEEQFMNIGLLCRETLTSLAQAVFDREKHPILDGTVVSETDSKRMLEAFIAVELPGSSNESSRKMAKTAVDVANTLTHRRTADFRLAAFSAEVTNMVVNMVSIFAGRRDPN
ncbi:hypothetical protein C0V70_06125 [Bacteriovorax stolpii]|uniref:Uncharacterized protein n=1 Tax=Bacteriovorax stolpii TaxID=960 RepID=A0A2K9NSG6_BACTC|nr:hypothetical protein [Bacteriovorax stolpii]AUN97694.1 hypothetical protein C0V70_06125 [Bacteriovorax stolpii]TDP51513.1 hypothetical protein C8D79_2957 [Bacteriovorax stolpii]